MEAIYLAVTIHLLERPGKYVAIVRIPKQKDSLERNYAPSLRAIELYQYFVTYLYLFMTNS